MYHSEENKTINVVNEAAAVYVRSIKPSQVVYDINKSFTFNDFLDNRLLVIHAIKTGVSYSFFSKLKKIIPFTDEDWAEVLNISTKSLQRYKLEDNFRFKPIHSEKIIEIAEVCHIGNVVFDSQKQFHLWLHTPSFALGGLKPFELLQDSYGKEMVVQELHKIEHGIFA